MYLYMEVGEIEVLIKKAITRHLVRHVQVPGDNRCRIDILAEEAAKEIYEKFKHNS